jgi:hypothetical protein
MKMEVEVSSETSSYLPGDWWHVEEDISHSYGRENMKPHVSSRRVLRKGKILDCIWKVPGSDLVCDTTCSY